MNSRALLTILALLFLVSAASAEVSYSYRHVEVDNGVIAAIKALFGIDVAPNYIEVTIDDLIVAQIPEDSPYADLIVHESCLGNFQYGTRDWYECEVPLQ